MKTPTLTIEGHETLNNVMNYIDKKLTIVQSKLEKSTLPEQLDEKFMDKTLLDFVDREVEIK